MNKILQNSTTMGYAVDTTIAQNESKWIGDVILGANLDLHKQNLTNIEYWREQQANGIISLGYSQDKEVLEMLLINSTMITIGAVKSFGAQTGNYALYSEINYTASTLARMADGNLVIACTRVHNVALANLARLGDYGITAPQLTLLMADITAYKKLYPMIRVTKVNVKKSTTNLALAVKKMLKDLKERIDNNMEKYRDDNSFYRSYKNARKTVNLNSATTGLEGVAKDAETGRIIKQCYIEVLLPEGNRQTSVNSRGHFTFKRLEMERCTVRVRAPHYTSAEFEIELVQGKMTHREILMMAETVVTTPTVNV